MAPSPPDQEGQERWQEVQEEEGGSGGSCRPRKKLKQSNLNGALVESLDVEGFGDLFQVQHPSDVTRVGFQNCGLNASQDMPRSHRMVRWRCQVENTM